MYKRQGQTVTGALLYNMRHGTFHVVEAAATLVATGGGPTQYRFHAPGPVGWNWIISMSRIRTPAR